MGLVDDEFDGGRLAPAELSYVGATFFPEGAKAYERQLAALGQVQQAMLMEREVQGDDRVYTYDVGYAKATIRVTIGIAADIRASIFSIGPKPPPLRM